MASRPMSCKSSSVRRVFCPPLPALSYGWAILRRNCYKTVASLLFFRTKQMSEKVRTFYRNTDTEEKEWIDADKGLHSCQVASQARRKALAGYSFIHTTSFKRIRIAVYQNSCK
jgi:hypothetical protein